MSDDRLIRDLRAIDRPIAVDPAFADRLFERLSAERRPRRRRLPHLLMAATLLVGASAAALVIGGGSPQPSETPAPVQHTYSLPSASGEVRVEYAVPSDLELITTESKTSLAFTAGSDVGIALDGQGDQIPPGARGVKIANVAGATAHYSNDRPMGVDAASFLNGLATHPVLALDVGVVTTTRIGTHPALTADIRSTDSQAHLDKGGVMIDLWPPSRLLVTDVGDAIVLVQVWAVTEADLANWLPDAERLLSSIELRQLP